MRTGAQSGSSRSPHAEGGGVPSQPRSPRTQSSEDRHGVLALGERIHLPDGLR